MTAWLFLGFLAAIAVVLFALAIRAGFQIARMTVERHPRLRPTEDLNADPVWQAARRLGRFTDEIRRHAEADPDIRPMIRLQRACYIAASIFGLAPFIYALLAFEALVR